MLSGDVGILIFANAVVALRIFADMLSGDVGIFLDGAPGRFCWVSLVFANAAVALRIFADMLIDVAFGLATGLGLDIRLTLDDGFFILFIKFPTRFADFSWDIYGCLNIVLKDGKLVCGIGSNRFSLITLDTLPK